MTFAIDNILPTEYQATHLRLNEVKKDAQNKSPLNCIQLQFFHP